MNRGFSQFINEIEMQPSENSSAHFLITLKKTIPTVQVAPTSGFAVHTNSEVAFRPVICRLLAINFQQFSEIVRIRINLSSALHYSDAHVRSAVKIRNFLMAN